MQVHVKNMQTQALHPLSLPMPSRSRQQRRQALLDLVMHGEYRTQEDLVSALADAGFEATQSSVSRDIRDLGLQKRDGIYTASLDELAGPSGAAIWSFARSVASAGDHLVVVKSTAGTAQALAGAIDRAAWNGIVGTVAGDDTVFIATTGLNPSQDLLRRIRTLADLDA